MTTQSETWLSPKQFVAVLVFQQLFDLVSTLYIIHFLGGQEANPLLAPVVDSPNGFMWLAVIKITAAGFLAVVASWAIRRKSPVLWTFKVLCAAYWMLILWHGYLITLASLAY